MATERKDPREWRARRDARLLVASKLEAAAVLLEAAARTMWYARVLDWRRDSALFQAQELRKFAATLRRTGRPPTGG